MTVKDEFNSFVEKAVDSSEIADKLYSAMQPEIRYGRGAFHVGRDRALKGEHVPRECFDFFPTMERAELIECLEGGPYVWTVAAEEWYIRMTEEKLAGEKGDELKRLRKLTRLDSPNPYPESLANRELHTE